MAPVESRPHWSTALSVALFLALSPRAVRAAEPADAAREHYQRGAQAFHDGRYEEAARAFRAAYELDPRGPLLLNIAQAHRLKAPPDCGEALRHYELFLAAEPQAAERDEVEGHVAEMRSCVATQRQAQDSVRASERRAPAPSTQARAHPAALWLMGAGALSLVSGGALYFAARDRFAELSARCPCPDDAGAQTEIDRWEVLTNVGYALSGVGLAALAGGAIWWGTGRFSRDGDTGHARTLWLQPTLVRGGAGIMLRGTSW